MQTVIETRSYLTQAKAKAEGMTATEMRAVVDVVAANPEIGELIVGSGGCRKVRIAGKGKGKSGGYRIVTFYSGKIAPTFLLAVLAKGSRETFSDAEVNEMAKISKTLVASLGRLALG